MIQTPFHPVELYPANLQTLIDELSQGTGRTPSQIKHLVQQANVTVQDLLPWADFNHPVADSYGRQLVHHGGDFEVMVMSWNPGDFSAIHDHGATQWGAVQCFGRAEHYIYQFSEGTLTTQESAPYHPGMIRAVNHSLIHQMGNGGTMPFLSLHVYGAPREESTITGNARVFDLFEGHIQYTDGGVFFCLPEVDINHRDNGVIADRETTLRHHCHMRDRIHRILAEQPNNPLQQKLFQLKAQIQQLRVG